MLICNDQCQEAKHLRQGESFGAERHSERASVSVSGIDHSDIRGLVTDRSMVRRERYRLRAWIKICQHSIFVDRSNRKCPKLLRDAFRHKRSAAMQSLVICHHSGMAGSRPQPRQRCEAALTLAARCDSSCVMLRHHAPDKAGEFSGDRRFCNIGFLSVLQGQPIVFSPESLVGFVCIFNDSRSISFLACFQRTRFITDFSTCKALCGFYQQHPHMLVPSLGNAESVLIAATGIFPRCKTEKSCVMTSARKAAETPGFCDHGKWCLRFNTEKTGQLVDVFPVFLLRRKFLNPSKFCRQIVVGQQVFFQKLLIQTINMQGTEPAEMRLRPVVLGSVIVTPCRKQKDRICCLIFFRTRRWSSRIRMNSLTCSSFCVGICTGL